MKSKLTILLIVFSYLSSAQVQQNNEALSFALKGQLKDRDTGKIVLWYPNSSNKWVRDTTDLKIGTFKFRGLIKEPSYVHLMGMPSWGDRVSFFLEGGQQSITIELINSNNIKVQGSKTEDEHAILKEKTGDLYKRWNLLTDDLYKTRRVHEQGKGSSKGATAAKLEILERDLDALSKEIWNHEITFIKQHPDSYVSPTLLLPKFRMLALDSAEQVYNAFTPRIKSSGPGILCSEEISKGRNVKVGMEAPKFTSFDINGTTLSLTSFKGKYVLLDFWASWCVPCRATTPQLKALYSKYHNKGFEIIAIANDDEKPVEWKKAITKDETNIWYHVLSGFKRTLQGIDNTNYINHKYAVYILPTKILINKEGVIIGRYTGIEEDKSLEEKLEDVLKDRK